MGQVGSNTRIVFEGMFDFSDAYAMILTLCPVSLVPLAVIKFISFMFLVYTFVYFLQDCKAVRYPGNDIHVSGRAGVGGNLRGKNIRNIFLEFTKEILHFCR